MNPETKQVYTDLGKLRNKIANILLGILNFLFELIFVQIKIAQILCASYALERKSQTN